MAELKRRRRVNGEIRFSDTDGDECLINPLLTPRALGGLVKDEVVECRGGEARQHDGE